MLGKAGGRAPERFRYSDLKEAVCGISELWVLNSGKGAESRQAGECIADGGVEWLSERIWAEVGSPKVWHMGIRVATVLGNVVTR